MRQLLVICGLLTFVVGCATTPPQDSLQSNPVAATPSQPSQPIEVNTDPTTQARPETVTPTAPKMIEVVVTTEPTIHARGSRLSRPTIALTPTPPTPSFNPKPLHIVIHDNSPLQTRATQGRQHEEIVIVPRPTSPDTHATPRFVDVTVFDETPNTKQPAETFIVSPGVR